MCDCFNSHQGSHFIVFFTEYSNSATHEKNRIYTLTDVYSISKENALVMLILPFKSGIGESCLTKTKKKAKIKLWMLVEFNRNTQKKIHEEVGETARVLQKNTWFFSLSAVLHFFFFLINALTLDIEN